VPILARKLILALHGAAIESGLVNDRAALLGGLAPSLSADLPAAGTPKAQVLSDLHALNSHPRPAALEQWLENAIALSSARPQASVFQEAWSALRAAASDGEERQAGDFVGRDYLFAAVESFVPEHPSGYLSIVGPSGSGKTTFLAELARRTSSVAYFCELAAGATGRSRLVEAISAHLHDRYGLSGVSTSGRPRHADEPADLLRRYATQLRADDPLIVAVDAVDEADLAESAPNANVMGLPAALPDHVYFVLTHRGPLAPFTVTAPWRTVDLTRHPEENDADVRAFLQIAMQRTGIAAWLSARSLRAAYVVSELGRRSNGSFMYARRVLDAIEAGRYADRSLDEIPSDLHSYHEERWRDVPARASVAGAERDAIAYVLAEARRPVSETDIVSLTGAPPLRARAMIAEIADLLQEQRIGEQSTYSIGHTSFREFLYWKDSVQAAGMTLADRHGTIDGALDALLGAWRSPAAGDHEEPRRCR
jgi:hypothetical protein